jgi:hypothetical protein
MLLPGHEVLTKFETKEWQLLSWVKTGQLQPFKRTVHPEPDDMDFLVSPYGYRRVFPPGSDSAEDTYAELCYQDYPQYSDLDLAFDIMPEDADDTEYIKLRKEFEQLEAQIENRETELSTAWEIWETPNLIFSEIIELLKGSYFRMEDIERLVSLDEKRSAENDDSAVQLEISNKNKETEPVNTDIKRLDKATCARKTYSGAKHFAERCTFEAIYNKAKRQDPSISFESIIRQAKKQYPDTIGPISNSTIRKWQKK